MNFHLITCIVERGKSDPIIDAAIEAGAQAATYYYARGRGLKEKLGLIGKLIHPEKEIILIVTKAHQTDNVLSIITKTGDFKHPGKCFAYVQPVSQASGFLD